MLVKERAKKLIISKTESTVSAKIKQTIRVNIAERETTPEVSGQLSLLLPLPKEKLETKDIFNRVKRFKASRNYDPHHIQLNKVKKGGPKPSGKKPLW